MFFFPLVILFLVQSTWGYVDETYYPGENVDNYLYSEEVTENENPNPPQRRNNNNNNFLRFGRSEKKYDTDYEDYIEDFARPTRSGRTDKNDHFIRFGRAGQDFLRFGRSQVRLHRDRDTHLRFGRSAPVQEQKSRAKRDTAMQEEYKRGGSNFLRFGRNSNFLRFGRNPDGVLAMPTSETEITHAQINELLGKIKQMHDSPLLRLLTDLAINARQDGKKFSS